MGLGDEDLGRWPPGCGVDLRSTPGHVGADRAVGQIRRAVLLDQTGEDPHRRMPLLRGAVKSVRSMSSIADVKSRITAIPCSPVPCSPNRGRVGIVRAFISTRPPEDQISEVQFRAGPVTFDQGLLSSNGLFSVRQ